MKTSINDLFGDDFFIDLDSESDNDDAVSGLG